MKLEHVIQGLVMIRHNLCQVSKDRATIHKAIEIIGSTRWRKLSEEQPPDKTEWYETWEIDHATPELALHKALWCQSPRTEKWKFKDRRVRWWRPIVGPEEES